MESKDFVAEVKSLNAKGEGVLRFIRFHQEDKDADITLPGFIGRQEAPLLVAHNWTSDYPPIGRGESFEADGATNFRFKLNMADARAKDWYAWLKMDQSAQQPIQQVSYGFSPYADGFERGQKDGKSVRFLKPRPDGSPGAKLHEVSFVVVGSGNDTAVVDVKSTDALLSGHESAVSGRTKESHRMESEESRVEPDAAEETTAGGSQEPARAEDYEDWKQYSDDKRPPLPVFIQWARGLVYHLKFVWDVRKRDGKEVSEDTTESFKLFVEECLEACALMKIKLLKERLLPTMEEEELERQRRHEKYRELTAHKTAQEELANQQLQAQAEDLARAARARSARMKELKL
jgi:hypothetical protein